MKRQTTALIILDGWGLGRDYPGNAIKVAKTPTWDRLWQDCPRGKLTAAAAAVGLPDGQMGNSEVGHTTLGAGRVVYQTLSRINRAIADGSLAQNEELLKHFGRIKTAQDQEASCLHLIGLLSDGGVHSHQDHFVALLELAAQHGVKNIFLHVFLDGRDTQPLSAKGYLDFLQKEIQRIGSGVVASVCGRYYAMDRDKRWERTQSCYDLLRSAPQDIPLAESPQEQLDKFYGEGITDEFVPPFRMTAAPGSILAARDNQPLIQPQDFVISVNFRADRVRQITAALADENFSGFARETLLPQESLLCMTAYDPNLPLPHIFAKEKIRNCLGEILAQRGLKQLRLAETEKFAHVTYFFNGGKEEPFPQEERKLIPSLKVATYDLAPQMRAPEITEFLASAISSGDYDFILCNYANGDMVGHSGKLAAAIKTVEEIDKSLTRLLKALDAADAQALITADHGNCEEMLVDDTDKPHTAHTLNLVPLLYYGGKDIKLTQEVGGLADIAPTILTLMGIDAPAEMSGKPLVV